MIRREERFKLSHKIILAGVACGASFWIIDAIIDAVIFDEHTVFKQISDPTPLEIYVRLVVFILFVGFSIVIGRILDRTLNEKELLIKEIHHRVKNHMQVLSSVLNLQSDSSEDEHALELLKAARGRVNSMSRIYTNLAQSRDQRTIIISRYLRGLLNNIFLSYKSDGLQVTIGFNVPDFSFDVKTASVCGLIVNELVTNVFKHAFKDSDEGKLHVELVKNSEHKYTLIIRDSGRGLPAGMDIHNSGTLGLELVTALTEQLGAKIKLVKGSGTEYRITFKDKSDSPNRLTSYLVSLN